MPATPATPPTAATQARTDQPLAGLHALVTGASRGIGAAIAHELSRLGAKLTLVARGEKRLADMAERLPAAGPERVRTIGADVTIEHEVAAAFAAASAAFGPPQIVVNNAGGTETAPFPRTDPAMWRRMIDLNLTSTYLCCRAALPAMTASGWGRIVNVASMAGLKGYEYVSAYVAAKHGVVGLTRALALECARSGVTVNAVCPGYTDTPMLAAAVETIARKTGRPVEQVRSALSAANPSGRLVAPEAVAAAVSWLALPSSGAVTGIALPIAGGEAE